MGKATSTSDLLRMRVKLVSTDRDQQGSFSRSGSSGKATCVGASGHMPKSVPTLKVLSSKHDVRTTAISPLAVEKLAIMLRLMKTDTAKILGIEATSQIGAGNELAFALYGAANRMARMHKPFLEPLGLTFSQYLVLLELFAGTPRTVGDLCAKLAMETGTITPLLKRLAAAGTVTRTRDVTDERRVLIELTSAGEALRDRVLAVSGQIKTACKLDEKGVSNLRGTLDDLAWPVDRADR